MRLPDLDPSGGAFKIETVLIDYDGPQLFVARNPANARVIALHVLPDGEADRWIFARISSNTLRDLRLGKTPLRAPFSDNQFGPVALATYVDGNPRLRWINGRQLDPDMLPAVDSYLEPSDDEKSLDALQEIIVSAPAPVRMIVESAKHQLWDLDPRILDTLSKFRSKPIAVAKKTHRLVMDIAFSLGEDRKDIPVKGLGSILTSTQALFDSLAMTELSASNSRGPAPPIIRESTRLDAVATFPSSFGIRLESHSGDLAGDTPAEIAFLLLSSLLGAVAAGADVSPILKSLSVRAQNNFKAFSKNVSNNNADLKWEAALPRSTHPAKAFISKSEMKKLTKYLERNVDPIREQFDFQGRLVAVNLKSRYFMLENDSETISGKIAQRLVPSIDERKINVSYVAKIEALTEINEATMEESTRFTMLGLEESDVTE